ncbi:high mobility group B protein 10-like [Neltuma alba]|uniref:high mobility group B protein 10-like n=1 Tax=Neltuma alba TaxID=207710 RepID=UPI0010A2BBC8|nr:high mobility group B protein 10-like [Prosopis alba]
MRRYTRRISEAKIKAPQIDHADAPKQGPSSVSDTFYHKLNRVWESFGLGLIIDARETLLDLFLFYSEVTRRGGYHQVSRERKWDELVSALKLQGSKANLPVQLEKCYALLLYPFEQIYHYRDPAQKAVTNPTLGLLTDVISSGRKREYEVSLSELTENEDGEVETKMCKEMTGSELSEQKMLVLASPDDKKLKKRRGAPQGHKTAYQIFIKQECARLRSCNEASARSNILHMAIDAWKNLTEIERQPFVEKSKKENERLMEAMKTRDQNVKAGVDFGDYGVTNCSDGLELTMGEEEPKEPLTIDMGYIPSEA